VLVGMRWMDGWMAACAMSDLCHQISVRDRALRKAGANPKDRAACLVTARPPSVANFACAQKSEGAGRSGTEAPPDSGWMPAWCFHYFSFSTEPPPCSETRASLSSHRGMSCIESNFNAATFLVALVTLCASSPEACPTNPSTSSCKLSDGTPRHGGGCVCAIHRNPI